MTRSYDRISAWHAPVPIRSRGFWLRSLEMISWASVGRASSPSGQAISSGMERTIPNKQKHKSSMPSVIGLKSSFTVDP